MPAYSSSRRTLRPLATLDATAPDHSRLQRRRQRKSKEGMRCLEACRRSLRVDTLCGRQHVYHALSAIEQDRTPIRNTLGGERDIEYGGNTIFPRHDGAVREIATGLHDEP